MMLSAVKFFKMKKKTAQFVVEGLLGHCGHLPVFLGFAPAGLLRSLSFADTLNEETGEGYQRPYSREHSLDFSKYIATNGTSTVPLVLNLRAELRQNWHLEPTNAGVASLHVRPNEPCMARVDCQHRLGELGGSEVPLAFMAFVGLDLRTEMALFHTINSKARGLSSSLTDFHQSSLATNLAQDFPHLYIARALNERRDSPWFRMVRYGGEATSGLHRRTSLRMLQKTVQRFLRAAKGQLGSVENTYRVIANYWWAISTLFPAEWEDPRHNLLTKGVGLYSLMMLLSDLVRGRTTDELTEDHFRKCLAHLKGKVDWSSRGSFAQAGGHKGAVEVYQRLRELVDV